MADNKNYEINNRLLEQSAFDRDNRSLSKKTFRNGKEEYEFNGMEYNILLDSWVSFKKDGVDYEFSRRWHNHVFSEEEVAELCSGGSVSFLTIEGELLYRVTGGLKPVLKRDTDMFESYAPSSYKLYPKTLCEFVPVRFPKKFEPPIRTFGYKSKTIFVREDASETTLYFNCKELPDAAQTAALLNGEIVELTAAELTDSDRPAYYYGYYQGADRQKTERLFDNSAPVGKAYVLYRRDVTKAGGEIRLNGLALPENLDSDKIMNEFLNVAELEEYHKAEDIRHFSDWVMQMAVPVFPAAWKGHIFTPEEIRALSNGQCISFDYIDSEGMIRRANGALQLEWTYVEQTNPDNTVTEMPLAYLDLSDVPELPYDDGINYFLGMRFEERGFMDDFVIKDEIDEFISYDPDGFVPF